MKRIPYLLVCLLFMCGAANAYGAYQDLVLADNPIAYYRFEETSGTTAVDSSGNGNNGTYAGGVLLGQPGVGSATGYSAGFDGVDDHVVTARTVSTNFTLEAWINTTASSLTGSNAWEGNGILWSDVGGNGDDFIVAILNNRLSVNTGNPDTTVTAGPRLNDGRWHHIAVTRTQGVGIELYVDGVLVGTGSTNNNPLTSNPDIMIGGNTLDSRYFNGRIDEVAYYDTVLTPAQIATHYTTAIASIPALGNLAKVLIALGLAAVAYIATKSMA